MHSCCVFSFFIIHKKLSTVYGNGNALLIQHFSFIPSKLRSVSCLFSVSEDCSIIKPFNSSLVYSTLRIEDWIGIVSEKASIRSWRIHQSDLSIDLIYSDQICRVLLPKNKTTFCCRCFFMEVNNLNKSILLGVIIVTRLTVSCEGINTYVVVSVVKLLYLVQTLKRSFLRTNMRLKFCYSIKITF